MHSSSRRKKEDRRSSRVKDEPSRPAEPEPAEPAVAAPPTDRAAPEEIPVPEDSVRSEDASRRRGRDRDRRRGGPQQERSASIRSVRDEGKGGKSKGHKGKKGGKGKAEKGKTEKGKTGKGKSKTQKGAEGDVTPRSAASAPVFGTFQSSMDGSWTMPPMMGMPSYMDPRLLAQQIQQRTGWFQSPTDGQWWFWSGSQWYPAGQASSWTSTTESQEMEASGSRGKEIWCS